jgi:hypothetical protein
MKRISDLAFTMLMAIAVAAVALEGPVAGM